MVAPLIQKIRESASFASRNYSQYPALSPGIYAVSKRQFRRIQAAGASIRIGSPCSRKASASPVAAAEPPPMLLQAFRHRAARPTLHSILFHRHQQACSRAKLSINCSSSGLTKRMLATVASSCSAAPSAGASMEPKARMAIFLPARRNSPCRQAARAFPYPVQRPARSRADSARAGYRGETRCQHPRHSFSSLGAITVMLGMQRR